VLQSDTGVIPMSESDSSQQNDQVVTGFLDQTEGAKVEFAPVQDPTMLADEQANTHLTNFLSRPQLVKTVVWNETDTVGTNWTFNPWHDFLNSTSTRKKLDNYAFINCTLKVKIVVNASPFYFGSTLVSYQPMSGYYTQSAATSGSTNAFIIPFSQMPHVWVYPQTSQGGEFKFPFFYHKNWLPLTANDTNHMGTITGIVVNQLASANGATGTGVTIQIWAWAEDVKLLGPSLQLAIQGDEYVEGKGALSKPASAVAKVAKKLKKLPVIGSFATATATAASVVSDVASLFGFSNPPVISPPEAFVPRPFPHFASPDISTPMEKLTLDPKQELTIDPRIAGLDGTDELLITNLVNRESFLTSCSISTTTAVDTVVFSAKVTPNLLDFYYDGTTYKFFPTPMDHVSRMFQYWRGDIVFRFRFICTAYHKGRIRVSYDPAADINANVPDYTSVFNQVIDIGETSDVEVRVPYMQAYAWLRTYQDRDNYPATVWHNGTSSPGTLDPTQDNGMIAVRVVTPITAPISSSTIYMQVFVHAAENFEVAAPVDLPYATFDAVQGDTTYELQSQEQSYAMTTSVIAGTTPGGDEDSKFLVNMGESVPSVRSLLRRTNLSYTSQLPLTSSSDFACINTQGQTIYPPWYGYDTNGRHSAKGTYTTGSNFGFNFCSVYPFHWVGRCFVGMRGSAMWHFNVDTVGTDSVVSSLRVYRSTKVAATTLYNITSGSGTLNTTSAYSRFYNQNGSGSGGSALTNQVTQTSIQVVLPDYNQARFHFCDPASGSLGFTGDGSAYQTAVLETKLKPAWATKAWDALNVQKYHAVGPDFTFFFFLCAPPWTWLPEPTAN